MILTDHPHIVPRLGLAQLVLLQLGRVLILHHSGGILLLQEIDRVTDVGLSFCAGEYYMCTAYGEENEIPDPLDTAESPYDWSVLESMPSIRWPVEED